jgi:hypothetical protein
MKLSLVILGIAVVAGLSVLAVESRYFGATTPDAARSLSSAVTASQRVERTQPRPPVPDAADNRLEIKTRYRSAARISSPAERDKEYGALAGYAAAGGDFELALEIAPNIAAAGERDESYTRIVHQAMTAGDFAAADKAAGKISSAMLRDEQFKKIAQSCPANTSTEDASSILGLEKGSGASALTRSDRAL